jgi:hypothetical protein
VPGEARLGRASPGEPKAGPDLRARDSVDVRGNGARDLADVSHARASVLLGHVAMYDAPRHVDDGLGLARLTAAVIVGDVRVSDAESAAPFQQLEDLDGGPLKPPDGVGVASKENYAASVFARLSVIAEPTSKGARGRAPEINFDLLKRVRSMVPSLIRSSESR